MNTEELKMILDMLRGAGVGVWWIALIYILKSFFETVLILSTIAFVFSKVISAIYKSASLKGQLEGIIGKNLDCDDHRGITNRQKVRDIVIAAVKENKFE